MQSQLESDKLHSQIKPTRNSFITTDRPDTAQLVDLHVYIIPKSVWKERQHLAQNEAIDDAISAGFVHVPQNMHIQDLRKQIEQLCGNEDFFPKDFIVLRSVGRCMTRVKPRQEIELRVKNFRPPQTFAPEIFLLEGRHEDYTQTPSASPSLSSVSYLFGNRTQRTPSRMSGQHQSQSPVKSIVRSGLENDWSTTHNENSHQPNQQQQRVRTKYPQIGESEVDDVSATEMAKLKEEQERLRRRQAELDRMRREAEEKKRKSDRDEEERRRKNQEEAAIKIQSSYRGFKDRKTTNELKRRRGIGRNPMPRLNQERLRGHLAPVLEKTLGTTYL
ncbi:unnamed protein product [Didymodactylos carnosus]|uniref:Uncharacterized protein n=1 Tax=Didymodactylos carnosus TaxID=1234261 RepID=A0A8S2JRI4_9BILA|nr:unnamed protein product [Didymodactylos carnosus]CAF3822594.1 unnamed protein product [Didymodactylos carnosus]